MQSGWLYGRGHRHPVTPQIVHLFFSNSSHVVNRLRMINHAFQCHFDCSLWTCRAFLGSVNKSKKKRYIFFCSTKSYLKTVEKNDPAMRKKLDTMSKIRYKNLKTLQRIFRSIHMRNDLKDDCDWFCSFRSSGREFPSRGTMTEKAWSPLILTQHNCYNSK